MTAPALGTRRFSGLAAMRRCGLWACAFPVAAQAHDIIKGGNALLNGFLHPFLSLPHMLAVIPLGILLGKMEKSAQAETGRRSPAGNDRLWWIFPVSLSVSLAFASFSIGFTATTYLLLLDMALGLLLVWDRLPTARIFIPLAAVTGLLMGLDFGAEPETPTVAANVGSLITLYFCFLMSLSLGESFQKRHWQRIGLRVLGSWISACALLALSLKVFAG